MTPEKPDAPRKRDWPRYAVGPLGNRARFDSPGDVPHGWRLETPLLGTVAAILSEAKDNWNLGDPAKQATKRGAGRPKKSPE